MANTVNGRLMPVDVAPSPLGDLLVSTDAAGRGRRVERLTRMAADALIAQGADLYLSHFATCTDPNRFRRLR